MDNHAEDLGAGVVEINRFCFVSGSPAEDLSREAGPVPKRKTLEGPNVSDLLTRGANVCLAGGGLLCTLLLLAMFYYYGWTGERVFTSWTGPLVYYGFPGLLAILLFGSLRLGGSHKVNLALCLCSAVSSIYAVEAGLTLWSSLPSVQEGWSRDAIIEEAKKQETYFDSRTKSEVIDDLRRRGIDAVPSMFSQGLLKENGGSMESVIRIDGVEVLPLASIANKVTVVCNETGQYLTYMSDQHGFHNPNSIWLTKPIDVVALGDSFVQGYCVPSEKNFVALVRSHIPATLNLGIEGDGPLVMLATLKEYAERLRPKVVLWFYFEGNDLLDLGDEKKSFLLRRYLTDGFSQGLSARQAEIDRGLLNYLKEVSGSHRLWSKLEEITALVGHGDRLSGDARSGMLRHGIEGIIKLGELRERLGLIQGIESRSLSIDRAAANDSRARRMKESMDLFQAILWSAKNSVSAWGGNLYFIYLPSRDRYDHKGTGPQPDRDRVLQVATTVGLPIIDMHNIFMKQNDPLDLFPFRMAGHYTEAGHRLVASEVLRSISIPR
jgi:hypothetical protein